MKDIKSSILFRINFQSKRFLEASRNLYYQHRLMKAGVVNAEAIFTHMSVNELITLYDLALNTGSQAKILEVGSYLGASSCYLGAAISSKNGHLFCVDTWENQTMPEGERDTFEEFNLNIGSLSNFITPIRKNSKDLIFSDIQSNLDLVFIDGDHNYSGVNSDFKIISPWIRERGILAFHDCIYFEGVSRTIGEALSSGDWRLGGHVDNLLWLRKLPTR